MPRIEDPAHSDGLWSMVIDDEKDVPHIMPCIGPRHWFAPFCWCHPVTDPSEGTVVHNVAH